MSSARMLLVKGQEFPAIPGTTWRALHAEELTSVFIPSKDAHQVGRPRHNGREEPLVEERERTVPKLARASRCQGRWRRLSSRPGPGWQDDNTQSCQ